MICEYPRTTIIFLQSFRLMRLPEASKYLFSSSKHFCSGSEIGEFPGAHCDSNQGIDCHGYAC